MSSYCGGGRGEVVALDFKLCPGFFIYEFQAVSVCDDVKKISIQITFLVTGLTCLHVSLGNNQIMEFMYSSSD